MPTGVYQRAPRLTVEERFWQFVAPIMDDRGCWEWLGVRDNGYGRIGEYRATGASYRMVFAHRFSYELHVGPLGELDALHKCDNPSCVNPHHLFPGTQDDNMTDAAGKGRLVQKITLDQRRHVLAHLNAGMSQCQVADMFGVRQGAISYIARRATGRFRCRKVGA